MRMMRSEMAVGEEEAEEEEEEEDPGKEPPGLSIFEQDSMVAGLNSASSSEFAEEPEKLRLFELEFEAAVEAAERQFLSIC